MGSEPGEGPMPMGKQQRKMKLYGGKMRKTEGTISPFLVPTNILRSASIRGLCRCRKVRPRSGGIGHQKASKNDLVFAQCIVEKLHSNNESA